MRQIIFHAETHAEESLEDGAPISSHLPSCVGKARDGARASRSIPHGAKRSSERATGELTLAKSSRRAILTGIPAAAIGIGTVTAAVRQVKYRRRPARPGAEFERQHAAWLALGQETDRLCDVFDAAIKDAEIRYSHQMAAWCQLRYSTGFDDAIGKQNDVGDRLGYIADEAAAIPATSFASLVVKARIILWVTGVSAKENLPPDDDEWDWDDAYVSNFVKEVHRLPGLESGPFSKATKET